MNNMSLDKTFNLPPLVTKAVKNEIVVSEPQDPKSDTSEKDKDFEEARANIKKLLRKGDEALNGILDLANNGEHPRSYEVAGQIIKTLVDANKDLLNLHKQSKEVEAVGKSRAEGPSTSINNAVFVGTTADLQRLRKEERAKKERESQNE